MEVLRAGDDKSLDSHHTVCAILLIGTVMIGFMVGYLS